MRNRHTGAQSRLLTEIINKRTLKLFFFYEKKQNENRRQKRCSSLLFSNFLIPAFKTTFICSFPKVVSVKNPLPPIITPEFFLLSFVSNFSSIVISSLLPFTKWNLPSADVPWPKERPRDLRLQITTLSGPHIHDTPKITTTIPRTHAPTHTSSGDTRTSPEKRMTPEKRKSRGSSTEENEEKRRSCEVEAHQWTPPRQTINIGSGRARASCGFI